MVVPARNEELFLATCLESILAQTHDNLEVLVVDGESTDGTPEIALDYARRDDRVRLVSNPGRIVPAGLNIALAEAKSAWFVRVDAHATVPRNYVELALSHLRSDKWGAVGGRKDGIGITSAGRAIAAAMASPFGVGGSTYHHGTKIRTVEHVPFGCYPVRLLRDLGGWDERLVVNQDFELDWRIRASGHEILFDPGLRIDWVCRQAIGDLFRQYRRYGRGKAKVALLHPKSLRPRHLGPPALVGWALLSIAQSTRSRRRATAMAAPYALSLAAASALTGRSLDRRSRMMIPAAFLAMHAGWGLGFWSGLPDAVRGFARKR